eukprot:759224-Amphidinium_carterae.1
MLSKLFLLPHYPLPLHPVCSLSGMLVACLLLADLVVPAGAFGKGKRVTYMGHQSTASGRVARESPSVRVSTTCPWLGTCRYCPGMHQTVGAPSAVTCCSPREV